jgi:hypothetical protein
MKYCPNCKKDVEDAKFCKDCGYNFAEAESQTAQPEVPQNSSSTIGEIPEAQFEIPQESVVIESVGTAHKPQPFAPASKRKIKKPFYKRVWFIILVVIVALAVIGGAIGGDETSTEPTAADKAESTTKETQATTKTETTEATNANGLTSGQEITLQTFAEMDIKSYLKSPKTAEFPGILEYEEWHFLKDGDEYVVKSWVDSENSYGALIRSNFVIRYKWSGDETDFTKQINSLTVNGEQII